MLQRRSSMKTVEIRGGRAISEKKKKMKRV